MSTKSFLRRWLNRQENGWIEMNELTEFDFVYDDADQPASEFAELYSYTEEYEFENNKTCFEESFKHKVGSEHWTSSSEDVQRRYLVCIQEELEMADRTRRLNAVKAVLYLVQGVFRECLTELHQQDYARTNVFLVYEMGLFSSFVDILAMEIENTSAVTSALRKPAVSVVDSLDLRLILNVLYTIVETMRVEESNDSEEQKKLCEAFREELNQPMVGDEILPVTLFNMMTRFCSGSAPHFPMKKVLLLLWKVMLVSLGGLRELHRNKNRIRSEHNLPPLAEDPNEVCRLMRPSSPPANAADLIEQQLPRRAFRSNKRNSLDEQYDNINNEDDDLAKEIEHARGSMENLPMTPPRPSTPTVTTKSLPWKPKVRQKDLDVFFDNIRLKFVGFQVKNDNTSMAGLPQPIRESIAIFKQYLYISLSELQIKEEEELGRNPLSKKERPVVDTPAEILYKGMLPSLPQYVIALLKILLAAAPTSKAKTDSINILADVLPEEMPTSVLQSMKLGIDVNRHKEVIVKAISAILLLILKHFKLNHVYQFEFVSQHLVFANCTPLVLKFFNQNIMSYVGAKNSIPVLDFPYCVIGEPPELTADSLENGDSQPYCWRNLFSCINLLRVLNKLTKWKHSRTVMLVVFKSAPILKRALKVKQAMMQLYVLKLLKMQTKYLGRQWRKSNMKTLSAIYQKVRHRLNDDWAYGNDVDARPWDFSTEECALRACVDRFNNRRYGTNGSEPDFQPVDNCILSVLGQHIDLNEEFKQNYEKWLDLEVFSHQTDWDQVIAAQ